MVKNNLRILLKMNQEELEDYLEENGMDITKIIHIIQVKALREWVGLDYQKRLDETYDRIHERGWGFSPFLSQNQETNGGYEASLSLHRMVPQSIMVKKRGERVCPYGGWFDWTIGVRPGENAVLVIRELVDPTKIDEKGSYVKDQMEEYFPVKTRKELYQVFRRETLGALKQLGDFSHLKPEPPILPEEKQGSSLIKCLWADDIDNYKRR